VARFCPVLSYANVTATLALISALGGGAYAAATLPANSVGSRQLKAKSVTPRKVAPATVQLFRGRAGDRGPRGERGPQGNRGPKGDRGAAGKSGLNSVALRQGASSNFAVAACAPGQTVLGGGASTDPPSAALSESRPLGDPAYGWRAASAGAATVNVWVLCAKK
jgi:hypothetical protein